MLDAPGGRGFGQKVRLPLGRGEAARETAALACSTSARTLGSSATAPLPTAVPASQIRAKLSRAAVAMRWLSALHVAPTTGPSCPLRRATSPHTAVGVDPPSHTRTVLKGWAGAEAQTTGAQ